MKFITRWLLLLWALILGITTLVPQTFAAIDFEDVHQWLLIKWMTRYETVEWFRQYDEITRGEASKFITQYAKVLNLSPNYTECTFSDIATYDYTLTPFIAEVCSYGLIKGSNGKYMPEWKLTEAQAATIIVRSLEGFKDETKEPWYIDYYTRAQELGLISNETVAWVNNTNITRGKLWTWLFLAYAGKSIPDSSDPDAAIGVSMNLTDSNGNKTDISGKMAVDIERQERVQWLIEYDAEKVNLAVAQGQQVVLNFAATRCPLCNALEADLDENEDNIPENLTIVHIDYDSNTELRKDRSVTSQHTLIYLDNKGGELFRNVKKEVTLVEIIEEITTN